MQCRFGHDGKKLRLTVQPAGMLVPWHQVLSVSHTLHAEQVHSKQIGMHTDNPELDIALRGFSWSKIDSSCKS